MWVGQHHQAARGHFGLHTARRIGLHQHLAAPVAQSANGQLHAVGFTGLVGVFAPGQQHDLVFADAPEHQFAGVSLYAGQRKAGKFAITDALCVADALGDTAPARA